METVSFAQVGIFLGCLGAIAVIALVLKQLFQRDPPLHREYATTRSVDDLKAEIDGLRREMHDGFKDLNADRSRSIGNLHAKVETEIKEVNQRIDEIPDRLIARLKEMKGLLD